MLPPAITGGREWRRRTAGALAIVAALHVLAFGVLFVAVLPGGFTVGDSVFGIGLALTAYVLGVRHAFDADHLAAIDNTTRTLVARGRPSVSVGLFFSLGHSSVVFVMAVLVAAGASVVSTLVDEGSTAHETLGVIGVSVSGLFLVLIGLINLVAFLGILRVWRKARGGELDEARLEEALESRGLLTRLLRPALRRIRRPGQMYPLGFLFGLGFDTATEISLLVLAGTGAATGLPWYAVLVLPLLFASGMSLFDTLDGAVMQAAYRWSVIRPVRRIYVNLTTTGLSVAVALIIGLIELVSVVHDRAGLTDPLTTWIAGLGLDLVGYLVVAAFLVVWGASAAYWRFGRVEERWTGGGAGAAG
ncbi:HoxN/HupN/NixA family nickel/cobalt transporter [Nakamurella flavida]